MKNLLIARIFRDIAKILEIKGENRFRIRAYDRAAQNIESLTEDIEIYYQEKRLADIPGIGLDLSEKIKEIIETGTLKFYDDLKKSIPEGLLNLLNIPSVGPKTVKLLYDNLKIKNISDLEEAINNNKLIGLPGIKEKTVENISKGIILFRKGRERLPLAQALELADKFIAPLKKLSETEEICFAGSLRRQKETIRDIDILVISKKPQIIMDAFASLTQVKQIQAKGLTKSSILTHDDIQVDCRTVPKSSFGAALVYFTGSKNFNIKLRLLAQKQEAKINEYGIFDKNNRLLAGRTEEEIFKFFNLQFIPPEIREDTGEIELAQKAKLPKLLELKDIKGDLHTHSTWSDGDNSIEEMALAARNLDYGYIAITDHSQSLKVANGLSIENLSKKKKQIEALNQKIKGIKILFAAEVDIDSNGNLDYPDKVLKEFNFVVAAVHTGFKQTAEKLTERIIRACENKYVNIIAHPTGRLWGVRDSYEIDFEKILAAAKNTNTALEINSFPQRLDLNDMHTRMAKEKGVKICINTDSHSISHLDNMKFGVAVARRGWLTKNDVLNTLSCDEFLERIKK